MKNWINRVLRSRFGYIVFPLATIAPFICLGALLNANLFPNVSQGFAVDAFFFFFVYPTIGNFIMVAKTVSQQFHLFGWRWIGNVKKNRSFRSMSKAIFQDRRSFSFAQDTLIYLGGTIVLFFIGTMIVEQVTVARWFLLAGLFFFGTYLSKLINYSAQPVVVVLGRSGPTAFAALSVVRRIIRVTQVVSMLSFDREGAAGIFGHQGWGNVRTFGPNWRDVVLDILEGAKIIVFVCETPTDATKQEMELILGNSKLRAKTVLYDKRDLHKYLFFPAISAHDIVSNEVAAQRALRAIVSTGQIPTWISEIWETAHNRRQSSEDQSNKQDPVRPIIP